MLEYGSLLVYLILWFISVFILVKSGGGIVKHLPFLFVLSLLFLYDFLTPFYGLSNGWLSLFGNDISAWFSKGIAVSFVSLLFMSSTYLFLCIRYSRTIHLDENVQVISKKDARLVLTIGVSAVVLWASLSGYGIGSLFFIRFLGGGESTGLSWEELNFDKYNYLKQCVEFLIPGLVLTVASDMTKREKIFWFLIVTSIFLSFGFRYRLILVFISIVIYRFLVKGIDKKLLKKVMVYGLIFISLNIVFGNVRTYVKAVSRGVDIDMTLVEERQANSFSQSATDNFFKYSRNYLSNMSLLKYIEEGHTEYDYGESMFYQILVRALPGFMFEQGKPFPKSLEASMLSWHSQEGLFAGEAFTYVMDFYFAYGIIGVAIFSSTLSVFLFFFSRNVNTVYKAIFVAVTTASLFHYITRGFLPGYLMSYMYMMLPLLYINIKNNRVR